MGPLVVAIGSSVVASKTRFGLATLWRHAMEAVRLNTHWLAVLYRQERHESQTGVLDRCGDR